MKYYIVFLTLLIVLPFATNAQQMDHSNMDTMPMESGSSAGDVTFDKEISTYKRGPDDQPALNYGSIPIHDNELFYILRANRFEKRFQNGDEMVLWDTTGWIGDDYNKLYLKSEGDYNTSAGKFESNRGELLYSRNISSFWDVQTGLRHDFIKNKDDRNFAVFSLYGLARYWFQVDASTYVSDRGDISARIEAEFDLLLTQRLILQPRFETKLALQNVREYNIGSGINSVEFGVRLRYEIRREFAPYIGVEWSQNLGATKNMLEAAGKDTSKAAIVVGLKLWF